MYKYPAMCFFSPVWIFLPPYCLYRRSNTASGPYETQRNSCTHSAGVRTYCLSHITHEIFQCSFLLCGMFGFSNFPFLADVQQKLCQWRHVESRFFCLFVCFLTLLPSAFCTFHTQTCTCNLSTVLLQLVWRPVGVAA